MARYRTVAYTKTNKRLKDYVNEFDSLAQLKIRLKDIFMFDVRIMCLGVYDKNKFLYEYVRKNTELESGNILTEIFRVTKEEQFETTAND